AGINPVDWKIRKGNLTFITGKKFPKILGLDFAGWIESTGAGVQKFQKRDKVFGSLSKVYGKTGSYAEYLVVSENTIAPKPESVSYQEAAALPTAGLTALQGLLACGLKKGQKILINGASGGVGTFAVQLAKIFGAANITAVCSPKNFEMVKALGAKICIDYTKTDFTTQETTYDVIFDAIGNKNFGKCKHLLDSKGIYYTSSPAPEGIKDALLTTFSRKKVKIGFARANRTDLDYLAGLLTDKKLQVIIDEQYDLTEVAIAHTYSESGHVSGKIIINIK
ncbi:MAG: NAD(P)-dependent alcohol dehydrogenase, partial [Verrucomicrobia bacterium]|nr:NAD(P)-dependent alcohol dehydrogenase [Cytophagales bacterium]